MTNEVNNKKLVGAEEPGFKQFSNKTGGNDFRSKRKWKGLKEVLRPELEEGRGCSKKVDAGMSIYREVRYNNEGNTGG